MVTSWLPRDPLSGDSSESRWLSGRGRPQGPPLLTTCGQHPFFWNVKECLLLSLQFQGVAGDQVGIRGGFSLRQGFIWKGILLRNFRDNFPLVVCLCRGLILALWEGEFFVVRDAHL